ncbi:cytochrome o ubiquinol oxidase subunit IV [Phenylobacterium sp. VNQ135]|uniref:cytochrome o ubiquinol oxidase subunit IV n=1 Tax=Phenylobacterium sp. VNQ135 TaxID=3400922 RepID=UPI003BFF3BB7
MSRPHAEAQPHADAHLATSSHGSRRGYLIGFGLSAVLTAIPFWLVMTGALGDPVVTAAVVVGLAFVQIVVHTLFFLHVNTQSEGGWTLLALLFTVVIVAIVISGSLWIMYHLNGNMMPMPPETMAETMPTQ